MNEEQAEVLIEELLQLKLEVAALRQDARRNALTVSAPHYIAALVASFVLIGAFLIYAGFYISR